MIGLVIDTVGQTDRESREKTGLLAEKPCPRGIRVKQEKPVTRCVTRKNAVPTTLNFESVTVRSMMKG